VGGPTFQAIAPSRRNGMISLGEAPLLPQATALNTSSTMFIIVRSICIQYAPLFARLHGVPCHVNSSHKIQLVSCNQPTKKFNTHKTGQLLVRRSTVRRRTNTVPCTQRHCKLSACIWIKTNSGFFHQTNVYSLLQGRRSRPLHERAFCGTVIFTKTKVQEASRRARCRSHQHQD
jgi:hypothetical protein